MIFISTRRTFTISNILFFLLTKTTQSDFPSQSSAPVSAADAYLLTLCNAAKWIFSLISWISSWSGRDAKSNETSLLLLETVIVEVIHSYSSLESPSSKFWEFSLAAIFRSVWERLVQLTDYYLYSLLLWRAVIEGRFPLVYGRCFFKLF